MLKAVYRITMDKGYKMIHKKVVEILPGFNITLPVAIKPNKLNYTKPTYIDGVLTSKIIR